MELDHATAAEIARDYIGASGPLTRLGWGIGGFVYLSPDGRAAVKVHRYEAGFLNEVEAYFRLRRVRTSRLHGVTIPKVHDERLDLKVIRMDFVTPPFLVDFAGVLFEPPDFPPDTIDQWHQGLAEKFGPNVNLVWAIYSALAQHGIWYTDLHPRNLWLEGHPEYQPMPREDSDESY